MDHEYFTTNEATLPTFTSLLHWPRRLATDCLRMSKIIGYFSPVKFSIFIILNLYLAIYS